MRSSTKVRRLFRSEQVARSDANGRHVQDIQLQHKCTLLQNIRLSWKKIQIWWYTQDWLHIWTLRYQEYLEYEK